MIYLDTSALIKLYLREEGSEVVDAIVTGQDEPLPVWFLHTVEMRNAFSLKLFRGELLAEEADRLGRLFDERLRAGFYVAPRLETGELAATATRLTDHTRRLGCRSLDILHVAAATLSGADLFITGDDRQRRLAEAAGLRVS